MKLNKKILAENSRYVLPTYGRLPVAFKSGRGAVLTGVDGKKYLDFLSGLAVTSLGHAHPRITRVLAKQSRQLMHVSNLYLIPEQIALAKKLITLTGMYQTFFCNSGAEANEAAIKLARHASLEIHGDPQRTDIICMEKSFHGRTLGALSATMQAVYQDGFGPLLPGFMRVPFDDLEALDAAITPRTCAVMLEPIQAEGGMNFPRPGYLKAVADLCQQKNLFLILDEVQTGCGRTGKFLAAEHENVVPDIVTLAKALGAGFPIGACLLSQEIAAHVRPGLHASTFGGNPLAAAVALEAVTTLSSKSLLARVRKLGAYLLQRLENLAQSHSQRIRAVHGVGLFAAIDLVENIDSTRFVMDCLERGLITNVVKNHVIRLAPPLIVTTQQIDQAIAVISAVLPEFSGADSR